MILSGSRIQIFLIISKLATFLWLNWKFSLREKHNASQNMSRKFRNRSKFVQIWRVLATICSWIRWLFQPETAWTNKIFSNVFCLCKLQQMEQGQFSTWSSRFIVDAILYWRNTFDSWAYRFRWHGRTQPSELATYSNKMKGLMWARAIHYHHFSPILIAISKLSVHDSFQFVKICPQ